MEYARICKAGSICMNRIITVNHPLIDHSLTVIRRKETTTEEFRRQVVAKNN